jgi:GNAT superfamily N-acetyltransferase
MSELNIERFEVPLADDLLAELVPLWQEVFPELSFVEPRRVLLGSELEHNLDVIYVARDGSTLAGTSHLTMQRVRPWLGGLGEVAVPPTLRQRGVATRLSALARDEFRELGGSVLYLGTVNPQAERVYRRLGWRRLAATRVMAWPAGPQSPEEFLADAFRGEPGGEPRWRIERLTPAARLPVIPLITTPHDWPVLDASTGVCSNRYHELKRCMSLYPLFEKIGRMPGGACFAAWADTGHLVGLATARPLDARALQVDGFTHGRFADALIPLLERCFEHAASADRDCQVLVSVEDFERRAVFEALGFEVDGPTDVQLDGHVEPGYRLIRRSSDARGLGKTMAATVMNHHTG